MTLSIHSIDLIFSVSSEKPVCYVEQEHKSESAEEKRREREERRGEVRRGEETRGEETRRDEKEEKRREKKRKEKKRKEDKRISAITVRPHCDTPNHTTIVDRWKTTI